MTFDFLGVMRTLSAHEVRYVLIGGVAANAHGSPSITQDIDICYERSDENIERLAEALRALHARLRAVDLALPFQLNAKALKKGDTFTFETDAGNFDCVGTPAGTGGYEDLLANAILLNFDDLQAYVASVDDLIRMKRAAGRPKDRIEVEVLGALRDEIEGRN